VLSEAYYRDRAGYEIAEIIQRAAQAELDRQSEFAKLMQDVKTGFGRTMTRLPEVFGVSRQTLYNWARGEVPNPQHHMKLRQLAAAARAFGQLGFKPTSAALDRTIANGKSLLKLLRDGADGDENARKLVRIFHRSNESVRRVNEIIGERKAPRPEVRDMGLPSFDENV
jgi:transcriptional regulator with XRE-family HTH domain